LSETDTNRPREAREAPATRELLVNRTSSETRAALVEGGRLTEIVIERESSRSLVGNIYKGRVSRILPGMQAAFVSVGLSRDAFLHVNDVDPSGTLPDELEGAMPPRAIPPANGEAGARRIEDLLREGQELLVQLTKEPIVGKGARITSLITLPGRLLVLMPTVDHVGVSRKIEDPEERLRLRGAVEGLRRPPAGCIVRTAAAGAGAEEIEPELRYLGHLWEEILQKAAVAPAGTLLHAEFDPVRRLLRDQFSDDFSRIVVDDRLIHDQCVGFLRAIRPGAESKVEHYEDTEPLFDRFGVQAELERALRSRVWLRSGGHIVINQTEALVSIDVNTGKYVGKRWVEETVVRTNLEAVVEVVRQIRLRDLAGIIVVDFIDMEQDASKRRVVEALETELLKDRARTKILQISDFGLVEITRQRTRRSLERTLCRPCAHCWGSGRTKTPETVYFEIQRELQRLGPDLEGASLRVRVHPEVADLLEDRRHRFLEVLPPGRAFHLSVERDPLLHEERFEILNLPGRV